MGLFDLWDEFEKSSFTNFDLWLRWYGDDSKEKLPPEKWNEWGNVLCTKIAPILEPMGLINDPYVYSRLRNAYLLDETDLEKKIHQYLTELP